MKIGKDVIGKVQKQRGKESSYGWKGSGIPEDEVTEFTVLIGDEEMTISKSGENGEWIEYGPSAEKKYMSYLKPSDILAWIRQDYPESRIKVVSVNGTEVF